MISSFLFLFISIKNSDVSDDLIIMTIVHSFQVKWREFFYIFSFLLTLDRMKCYYSSSLIVLLNVTIILTGYIELSSGVLNDFNFFIHLNSPLNYGAAVNQMLEMRIHAWHKDLGERVIHTINHNLTENQMRAPMVSIIHQLKLPVNLVLPESKNGIRHSSVIYHGTDSDFKLEQISLVPLIHEGKEREDHTICTYYGQDQFGDQREIKHLMDLQNCKSSLKLKDFVHEKCEDQHENCYKDSWINVRVDLVIKVHCVKQSLLQWLINAWCDTIVT